MAWIYIVCKKLKLHNSLAQTSIKTLMDWGRGEGGLCINCDEEKISDG